MGDLLPRDPAGPAAAERQALVGYVTGPPAAVHFADDGPAPGPDGPRGLCLTGLFPHGVPQRAPAGCAVSRHLGKVVLPLPPAAPRQPDIWQILAVWFPAGLRVADVLDDSAGANRRVGGTTVLVRRGAEPAAPFRVVLRRPAPSDPPLVYALPLLLAEAAAALARAQARSAPGP
jgi:hypothetical protein